MTKRTPYTVKFVSSPMQSGMELSLLPRSQSLSKSGERSLEILFERNAHIEHDRASFECKAVSRSFPCDFHSPSRQSNFDIVSMRSMEKGGKKRKEASVTISNCNYQLIVPSSRSCLGPPFLVHYLSQWKSSNWSQHTTKQGGSESFPQDHNRSSWALRYTRRRALGAQNCRTRFLALFKMAISPAAIANLSSLAWNYCITCL